MREGTTLNDRYELREEIGRGGQGVVWRAWDPRLGRDVAVKRVALTGFGREEAENANARLMREAKVMARVVHGNVVQLFDSVEHEGEPWLVLEYVPSRNLAEVLAQEGRLEPTEAARIGARIADGLAAAHAVGVEHRDIKPGNVLLTEKRQVKLTDFGIARAVGDQSLTRTGSLSATLPYLAVEVARGMGWSPAADIWALGATLHTAVEGAPPFGFDEDDIRLLHRIMSGDFAVPRHAGPLTDTLLRLLATDPAARVDAATAAQMLDDVHAGRSAVLPPGPVARPVTVPPVTPGDLTRPPAAGTGQGVPVPRDVSSGPQGWDVASGPRSWDVASGPQGGPPYPPQGPSYGAFPYPGPPPGRKGLSTRATIVAAVVAVLVLLGGITAGIVVSRQSTDTVQTPVASGPSIPPLPATVGVLSVIPARERDADPCALLDRQPLEQFGRTEQLPGDTLDSCQISIAESQSTTGQVDVRFGTKLAAGSEPAGAQEKLGELTIVRGPVAGTACRRTLILSDRTPIYVDIAQYGDTPAPSCALADVATSSAVNSLATAGVVYVPSRLSNYVLASTDACTLLDPATLTSAAKVDGTKQTPGFGRLSCAAGGGAQNQPRVTVELGAIGDPSGGAFGRKIQAGGREAYVQNASGEYNANACQVTLVARSYAGTTGVAGAEVATIKVEGPSQPDQLCTQATALAAAAAPRLPAT